DDYATGVDVDDDLKGRKWKDRKRVEEVIVFEGVLPNGQEIAVKRLSEHYGQVILEFKNEVVLLAKLQHRNLARLCLEDGEKIHVYEYVLNQSLEYFLYGTIDSLKYVLTQPALDALCENYHIPDDVHPQLPGRHDKIRNSPTRISRYYTLDEGCYPTFWDDEDKEMNLFAFIRHADPHKVKVGEKGPGWGGIEIVANNEIHAIVANQPKKIRKKKKVTDGAGGSGLLERSTLAVEVGVTAATIVPFVTSFVTSLPEHEDGGGGDSTTGPIIRTRPAPERFVVRAASPVLTVDVTTTVVLGATSVPVHDLGVGRVNLSIFRDFASPTTTEVDVAGLSQPVGTNLSTGSFYISQDMNAETLRHVYISKWNIINDSVLDDPYVCRGMIDHLTPPGFFS
nr:cysteine-rich receptor-like protein kinase 10 [Tanacetum cinerariifolium]